MSDHLPKGWEAHPLAGIVDDASSGFACGEKNVENGVRHLRMNNIGENGELVMDLVRTVPSNLMRAKYQLLKGDVVVCTTNSGKLVGKVAIFDHNEPFAFSNHLTRLRPKQQVVAGKFLRWALWLAWRSGEFEDKCKHWVNQSTLPKNALLDLPILLPPRSEQDRIIAKTEKALSKVEHCKRRLDRIPLLLKRFRQAVLAAACSGRLTADWRQSNKIGEDGEGFIQRVINQRNLRFAKKCDKLTKEGVKVPKPPKNLTRQNLPTDLESLPPGWSWAVWDDLADWITYGFTRPMPHVERGIPVVTAKNVRDGYLEFENVDHTTAKAFSELSEKDKPRKGEILITKDGAIRGRAALVDRDEPFCISQAVAVVRFGGLSAHPEFLLRVIQSKFTQNLIQEESMGTAIPHISITNFGRFPVPVPPESEQVEIVSRVNEMLKLADQLEARYAKAKAHVDKLTQSILAKAFRGELVPQDPKDEPASVLLERMKANT